MAQIDAYWELRERMVDEQLGGRDISDRRVLEAMRFVPRHRFVPQDAAELAYIDAPLPIGFRQTISQPYIVALMTQLLRLRGDEVVLEVGTGSGYQAAVLGRLARRGGTRARILGPGPCGCALRRDPGGGARPPSPPPAARSAGAEGPPGRAGGDDRGSDSRALDPRRGRFHLRPRGAGLFRPPV